MDMVRTGIYSGSLGYPYIDDLIYQSVRGRYGLSPLL